MTLRPCSALLVALAVVAGACTADGPPDAAPSGSPSASGATAEPTASDASVEEAPSVAVVLPARQARSVEQIEVDRANVELIAADAIAEGVISSIRTVVPDRITTVGDVLEALAEDGHDLVCALGPGAARAVRDAAARFPGTKFCVAPGRLPDVPGNALVFDVQIQESAYLAGVAAAEAAAVVGRVAGRTPAIVVADSGQANRLQAAFDQGFQISAQAATDDPTPVRVATSQAVAFDTATSLYDSGVYLIYASAGRVEQGVVTAAEAQGRLVIGTSFQAEAESSQDPTADPTSDGTEAPGDAWNLMQLGENLSAAFRDTLVELANGWTGGTRSIGFRNGALTLTPGTSPVWERIAPQVLRTRDALVAGTDLQIAGG